MRIASGFRLGFRVNGFNSIGVLGFRVLGFRVVGLWGCGVVGFRVMGEGDVGGIFTHIHVTSAVSIIQGWTGISRSGWPS